MPSTRDPVVTVQPGPGRLPANTVPASALIFPPGGNSDAALQAHITDPVGAHADSAISSLAYSGATWSAPSGSVRTAVTEVFQGLNSRPTWVLDANGAGEGDFVGASALINAVAAATATPSVRPQLYLRPGVYNWNDAVIVDNCTIIGAVPQTTSVTHQVRIQNLAGAMRFGSYNTVKNVNFNLSGKLQVLGTGSIGYNLFDNISLDVTGDIEISSLFNRFNDVGIAQGSVVPAYVNVTLGFNEFSKITVSQMRLSDTFFGSNQIAGLFLADGSKYPVDPVFWVQGPEHVISHVSLSAPSIAASMTIAGNRNVLSGVAIRAANPATASEHVVKVTGSNNKIAALSFSAITFGATATSLISIATGTSNTISDVLVSANAGASTSPLISVASAYNVLSNVRISSGSTIGAAGILAVTSNSNLINVFNSTGNNCAAATASLVDISGSDNAMIEVVVDSATAGSSSAVRVTGDRNSIDGVLFKSLSGYTKPLLWIDGTGVLDPKDNRVTKIGIDTVSGQADRFVSIEGRGNAVRGIQFRAITTPTVAAIGVQVSGQANAVSDVVVESATNFAAALISFLTAQTCTFEGFNNINGGVVSFASTGQIITFSSAQECVARSIRVEGCTTFGLTVPVIQFDASSHCIVESFALSTCGSVAALAASIIKFSSGTCRANRIINFEASTITRTGATALIDVDTTIAINPVFESVDFSTGITTTAEILKVYGATANTTNKVTFRKSNLVNANTVSTVATIGITSCGSGVVLESVYAETNSLAPYTLTVSDSRQISVLDGTFVNSQGRAGSVTNTGGAIERCGFIGGSLVPGTGTQLFNGYGHDGVTYSMSPLAINDCFMEYGSSNCNPGSGVSTGLPIIFFGGNGLAAVTDHGRTQVNGLLIYPGASVTAQHRDSLLVIDSRLEIQDKASYYNRITIDLKEIPWSASGSGRGTLFTDAAVIEMFGPDEGSSQRDAKPYLGNIQIYNVKESTGVADVRNVYHCVGSITAGLIVEGPSSLTHGTGSFAASVVLAKDSTLTDVYVGRKEALLLSGTTSFLDLDDRCDVSRGIIRSTETTSGGSAVSRIIGDDVNMVEMFLEFIDGGMGEILNVGGNNAKLATNRFRAAVAIGLGINVSGSLELVNSRFTGSISTAAIDFVGAGGSVTACRIENSTTGCRGVRVRSGSVRVGVQGNYISGDDFNAVDVDSSDGTMISNNRLTSPSGEVQVVVTGGCVRTVVNSNIIDGSSAASGAGSNIGIDTSASTGSVIVGNSITNRNGGNLGYISADGTDVYPVTSNLID